MDLKITSLLNRTGTSDVARVLAIVINLIKHYDRIVGNAALQARRVSDQSSSTNQGPPGVIVITAKRECGGALLDDAPLIGDHIVELLIGADIERQRRTVRDFERRPFEAEILNRRRICSNAEDSRSPTAVYCQIHRGAAIDRQTVIDIGKVRCESDNFIGVDTECDDLRIGRRSIRVFDRLAQGPDPGVVGVGYLEDFFYLGLGAPSTNRQSNEGPSDQPGTTELLEGQSKDLHATPCLDIGPDSGY